MNFILEMMVCLLRMLNFVMILMDSPRGCSGTRTVVAVQWVVDLCELQYKCQLFSIFSSEKAERVENPAGP